MFKKYLKTLIISSLITLLPIPLGFALWDILPNTLPIHWGLSGEADGYSSKLFAILLTPLILLVSNWLIFAISLLIDRKSADHNAKMQKLALYVIPTLSVMISCFVFAVALDFNIAPLLPTAISVPCGLLMMLVGNYLPKCRHNYTMGIKIGPTLESEENWNATHRFGGKIWFVCGLLMLPCALVPLKFISYPLATLFVVAILVPTVYSYIYRVKHPESLVKSCENSEILEKSRKTKRITIILASVLTPIFAVLFAIIMFTGEVYAEVGKTAFSVSSTYYSELTVDLADIEKVEFLETDDAGQRVSGFGSATLLLGNFKNEALGKYTRYSYTGGKPCIVITAKENSILVVGLKTREKTKALYDKLSEVLNDGN